MTISLVLILEIEPSRVDDFLKYLKEEAHDSRTKEPGCRQFIVSQSTDEPNKITLFEEYDDQAALDAHSESPHFKLFFERAGDLILSKTMVKGTVVDS